MAAVARIDPKTFFTPEEWNRLSAPSFWRGPALVLGAWAVIIGAGGLFVLWPNVLTYGLAVVLIGARQLGLGILEHEAAHGGLHPNRRFNDWMAEWLCGGPVGGSLRRYRPYHLAHHKYTEQEEDPDRSLSAPFPTTRRSLTRKAIRDLTGQTFFKQRIRPALQRLGARVRGETLKPPRVADRPGLRFWVVNGAAIAVLSVAGLWWVWPALWIVPMATWLPLVTRIRNIAEHAVVQGDADPFTHARTTLANPLERLLIAPYWVHFHAEHHLFMYLPCYRLEQTHRLLIRKGYGPRLRLARSYRDVLELAASRPTAMEAAS